MFHALRRFAPRSSWRGALYVFVLLAASGVTVVCTLHALDLAFSTMQQKFGN
jgi:hypothetical protein